MKFYEKHRLTNLIPRIQQVRAFVTIVLGEVSPEELEEDIKIDAAIYALETMECIAPEMDKFDRAGMSTGRLGDEWTELVQFCNLILPTISNEGVGKYGLYRQFWQLTEGKQPDA